MVGVEIPSVDFFARYGNVYNIDSQFLVAYDRNSNYISTPRTNFLGTSLFSDEVQRFFNFNSYPKQILSQMFLMVDYLADMPYMILELEKDLILDILFLLMETPNISFS